MFELFDNKENKVLAENKYYEDDLKILIKLYGLESVNNFIKHQIENLNFIDDIFYIEKKDSKDNTIGIINYYSLLGVDSKILRELYSKDKIEGEIVFESRWNVYIPIVNVVYFLLIDGAIKIGHTNDLLHRLLQYQTHTPNIRIMASFEGNRKYERALHKKFSDYHINNEYFELNKEIIDYIEDEYNRHCELWHKGESNIDYRLLEWHRVKIN
jgi:hypothetical protein